MAVFVRFVDLLDALERCTWGEKRRAGAKKGGLKRASVRQTAAGLELLAPNGVHEIAIVSGKWEGETFFDGATLPSLYKWLKAYVGTEDTVKLDLNGPEIVFSIGSARRRVEAFSHGIKPARVEPPAPARTASTSDKPPEPALQKPLPPIRDLPKPVTPQPVPVRPMSPADVQFQAMADVERMYPELAKRHNHAESYFLPAVMVLLVLVVFKAALETFQSFLGAEIATMVVTVAFLWLSNRERHKRFDRLLKERAYELTNSVGNRGNE